MAIWLKAELDTRQDQERQARRRAEFARFWVQLVFGVLLSALLLRVRPQIDAVADGLAAFASFNWLPTSPEALATYIAAPLLGLAALLMSYYLLYRPLRDQN